jgi:hypothetical protein
LERVGWHSYTTPSNHKQNIKRRKVMPGFNQKGPDGAGAMTGRQRGMCRRTENPAFAGGNDNRMGSGRGTGMRRGLGLGQGRGPGQGFGLGRRFAGTVEQPQGQRVDSSEELKDLKEQYQAVRKTLSTIEEKLAALKGE